MELAKLLTGQKKIRVIGFDDAHYADKTAGSEVNVAGVVCSNTRFEGMLWNRIAKDGMDATEQLIKILGESKFADQVQIILIDGITLGGCNIVNLQQVYDELKIPTVAVMRRQPDLVAFRKVVEKLSNANLRWTHVEAAGPIHELEDFVFQVVGETPLTTSRVLRRLTDQGKVPEALRLAHLIGSAIKLGTSGKRA